MRLLRVVILFPLLGEVERFLERPGPTSVAKEHHLRDGQILRWALRGVNSILVKIE